MNCSKCIHSLSDDSNKQAAMNLKSVPTVCRRFPPVVLALSTPQGMAIVSQYPQVDPEKSFCGEFVEKVKFQ